MNQAELIDLSEYDYSGEGANGASYNHKTNPNIMLKIYNTSKPYSFIKNDSKRRCYSME